MRAVATRPQRGVLTLSGRSSTRLVEDRFMVDRCGTNSCSSAPVVRPLHHHLVSLPCHGTIETLRRVERNEKGIFNRDKPVRPLQSSQSARA